jgi:hypothetical protein
MSRIEIAVWVIFGSVLFMGWLYLIIVYLWPAFLLILLSCLVSGLWRAYISREGDIDA